MAMERCELCALPVTDHHPHLFDRARRALVCACDPCATLFDLIEASRYRRIRPAARRIVRSPGDDEAWTGLGIPVGLAFVTRDAGGTVVAALPGPAGVTVAEIDGARWQRFVADHPELADLEPDVEAVLVNRLSPPSVQLRVSIDHCYRLAGLVRSRWAGLYGGPAVAAAIAEFCAELDRDAA